MRALAIFFRCQHGRRELNVHEDDVDLCVSEQCQALPKGCFHRLAVLVFPCSIGADLPDHDRRPLGDDIRLHAAQLVRRLLSPNTAVEHVKIPTGAARTQRALKPKRIGNDAALPGGSRRADRGDLDGTHPRQLARQSVHAKPKRNGLGRDHVERRIHRATILISLS